MGILAIGRNKLVEKNWLFRAVKRSGAVSPVMRAKPINMPVRMPARAAFQVTLVITTQAGAPNATAASRISLPTRLSISSVVRTMIGIIRIASATLPASAEKCPIGATTMAYANKPISIDGALNMISLMKRTRLAVRLRKPYSANHVPAINPTGTPMSRDNPNKIKLPTKALRKPNASVPGGGVSLVNRFQCIPARPNFSVVQRIQNRKKTPTMVAAPMRILLATSITRRFACTLYTLMLAYLRAGRDGVLAGRRGTERLR